MTNIRIIYRALVNGIIVALVSVLLAYLILPLKYAATTRILVVPHEVPGVDPYTSSKSAERIAQNMAEILSSSQFFKRVISISLGIDPHYFPDDELERRKLWNQTIDASVGLNTGILTINIYHKDPDQAVRISTAVIQVLTGSGGDFSVNSADFRVVDSPVASKYPKQPNFPAIAAAGLLGGAAVSVGFYIFRRKNS